MTYWLKLWHCLVLGVILRISLMLYGEWQDRTMIVKYTDIDYHVFTDAARFVTQGKSPYLRATYRYTPLLAILLTPNVYVSQLFGKTFFIVCDILAGYLIYRILKHQNTCQKMSTLCAAAWLLNPLPATVSTRGNAESIMAVLVLNTIYLLISRRIKLSACVYAAAVHMKIYPVTYALPIYLLLKSDSSNKSKSEKGILCLWPNRRRIEFISVAAVVFCGLTGICYAKYGFEFLEETYLYHITRRDIRHNFSVYFYMLYLTAETELSSLFGILAFLPQFILLVTFSFYYYQKFPYCCFLHTFVFVTFNKVCTSQYFLWYLCLLPLIIPDLHIGIVGAVFMVISWFLAQALWLSPAYYLEFEGINTYIYLWTAGLIFFAVNVGILYKIIVSYGSGKTSKVKIH